MKNASPLKRLQILPLLLPILRYSAAVLVTASVLCVAAHADFAISLGEQKARPHEDSLHGRFMRFLYDQGSGDPGHAVLYVSELCNDDSYFRVRLCKDEDETKGVYLSFISNLSGGHSWIAVPPSLYLYGVKNMEDRPLFATTFNLDHYRQKEDKRPDNLVSQDPDFKESRYSSLDRIRQQYLDGGSEALFSDGSLSRTDKKGASDKVNLFVTSERDVYNIVIHGDTSAQAQKLLDYFNSKKNLTAPPVNDPQESVEGKFGWWKNWGIRRLKALFRRAGRPSGPLCGFG